MTDDYTTLLGRQYEDLAEQLLRRTDGVGGWEREYRFAPPRRWRFDFAWVYARVALEVDGGVFLRHGGRHNSDPDREKLNAAAAAGWRVVRVSATMLAAEEKARQGQAETSQAGTSWVTDLRRALGYPWRSPGVAA